MTSSDLRRVRTVHLKAPSEELVQRGATLLEDALHTASIPQGEGGRLLLVRTFDVGKIDTRRSASRLAVTIEERLRQLGSQAVHAADPAAGQQAAVTFRNDAEAYVMLATRIAQGRAADGWFWPLAVRGWQPAMARSEALRCLLGGVLETQAGPAAAVELMRQLANERALDPLLETLAFPDGATLIQAFGWSDAAPGTQARHGSGTARRADAVLRSARAPWRALLGKWAPRWGRHDARTRWLAAVALVVERPARLSHPNLMAQAATLVEIAARPVFVPDAASAADRPPSNEGPTERTQRRPTDQPGERLSAEAGPSTASRIGAEGDGVATPAKGERRPREQQADRRQARRGARPRSESTTAPPDAEAPADAARPRDGLTFEAMAEPNEEQNADGGTDAASRMAVSTGESSAEPFSGSEPGAETAFETSEETPAALFWPDAPLPSAYAGLFFLLPVMAQLGLAAFLQEEPHWLEWQLPARLLQRVGTRLAMPDNDPSLLALDLAGEGDEPASCDFLAPAAWQQGIARPEPWTLRPTQGPIDAWVLQDGSARLALACWTPAAQSTAATLRPPPAVERWLGERSLQVGATLAVPSLPALVLDAWQTAMRRWCRRVAGLGLHDLVRRPGYVSATRTHIDLYFRLDQADLRVRRAGLDINPGWLPWLGRVVYFHYLEADLFGDG